MHHSRAAPASAFSVPFGAPRRAASCGASAVLLKLSADSTPWRLRDPSCRGWTQGMPVLAASACVLRRDWRRAPSVAVRTRARRRCITHGDGGREQHTLDVSPLRINAPCLEKLPLDARRRLVRHFHRPASSPRVGDFRSRLLRCRCVRVAHRALNFSIHSWIRAFWCAAAASRHMAACVLDERKPLRESILWALQSSFYDKTSIRAWSEAIVPNFVTSNAFIANCYARCMLGMIRDWFLRCVRCGCLCVMCGGRPKAVLACRSSTFICRTVC